MDYWFLFDRIVILYAEQYLSRKAAVKSKHSTLYLQITQM